MARISNTHVTWLNLCLWLAPFSLLWLGLTRQLSVEWSLNPQYRYGWAVPALCLLLLYRDFRPARFPTIEPPRDRFVCRRILAPGIFLSVAYGLTRLVQEANPDWRLVSWMMASEVAGLTLLGWRLAFDRSVPAFPILFFLIAVPWPTLLEAPIVHALTVTIGTATTEVLGWLDFPAVLRGNTIEVSSGMVGIEEACSGIRSLQASIMVGLFFGHVYRLKWCGRLLCLGSAAGLAVFCNLARTLLLTVIAVTKSPDSLSRWHDMAGVPMQVTCFMAVWFIARSLRDPRWQESRTQPADATKPALLPLSLSADFAARATFPLLLLLWILTVELGTRAWYHACERSLPAAVTWHIAPPREQAHFRELPFSPASRRILRFDQGLNAVWVDDDGLQWQAIFLQWNRGGTAIRLARNHTPTDCLAAAGLKLIAPSGRLNVSVGVLELPFRSYLARNDRGLVRIFYCLWEDRCSRREFDAEYLTYAQRLYAVLAGERNSGQRSLELALNSDVTEQESEVALHRVLNRILLRDH